ncbi:OB-fold protein [Flavobacterium sp.]|uniref:OB-fold protein n=1 Tax=Flavobacterium sp. TaxID=239 RepID=UPI0038FD183A
MTKKKIIISLSVVVIVIVAVIGFNYVLHGGARDLSSEDSAFCMNSKNLIDEYAANVEGCNKKYLDKAIAIAGTVTSINGKEVILDNSIICNLKDADATIKENQSITLKGRLVGYDDLMGEIKLDQCFKAQ